MNPENQLIRNLASDVESLRAQLAELTAQRNRAEAKAAERSEEAEKYLQNIEQRQKELEGIVDELDRQRKEKRAWNIDANLLKEKLVAAQLEIVELRRVLVAIEDTVRTGSRLDVQRLALQAINSPTVSAPLLESIRRVVGCLKWIHDPREDAIERFDRIADWFHKDTGLTRPGRSTPPEMGAQDREAADQAMVEWVKKNCIETVEAIAALEPFCR